MKTLQAAVKQLFEQQIAEQVDEAVYEYIAGIITSNDSLEVVEMRDLLESFSSNFMSLPIDAKNEIVQKFCQQVTFCKPGGPSHAAASSHTDIDSCLKQLRTVCLNAQEQQNEAHTECRVSSQAKDADCAEAMMVMKGLCSTTILDAFLQYLISVKCGSDLEAAAAYVMDSTNLVAEQEAWQVAEQQRAVEQQQAELDKQLNRKKIVEKFQLQPVVDDSGRKPQHVTAWSAKEDKSKVRYRDGMMVPTKGAKYIIEKVGEDWDGGSRGKVYTKGKRGKGFM